MYIIKNAFRCINRAKGRNFLIGLIVVLLSVSSCLGLSIRQANRTLKKQYSDNMEITATLNTKSRKDTITLDVLTKLSEDKSVKSFYKTASLYFSAGDGIEPIDVAGSFKQNKDFRKEYGDIKSGESTTSTVEGTSNSSGASNNVVLLANELNLKGNTDNQAEKPEQTETAPEEKPEQPSEQSSETPTEQPDPDANNKTEEKTEDNAQEKTDETAPEKPQENTEEKNEDKTPDKTQDKTSENSQDKTKDKIQENTQGQTQDKAPGKTEEKASDNTEQNTKSKPDTKQSESKNSDSKSSKKQKNSEKPSMPEQSDDSPKGDFDPSKMPGGDTFITNNFFFNMASMNDFTVVGCDDTKALPSYVSSLDCLDMTSADNKCVISKNLAEENGLKAGDKFTLLNPENSDETYTFTIAGIGDSSESSETENTSSNAGFTDNTIYVNYATVEKIIKNSSTLNGDTKQEDNEEKLVALSASYSGTFTFANLTDYNNFSDSVSDDYAVVSEDVSNYEKSISQLETLGKYATYFLIVIFTIGAFVLIIINLFSIRNRKYEIGVLTAIGMKKYKVALQFVTELFVVTFIALIIGSSVGAATSVPVTNKLLTTINTVQSETGSQTSGDKMTPPDFGGSSSSNSDRQMPPGGGFSGFNGFRNSAKNYIASVNSATNLTVILEMIVVGIILTLISSLAAMLFVMRYEPLKILNNRD